MFKSRNINRICCIVMALAVLVTGFYTWAVTSGSVGKASSVSYENRLFDQSRVHTINIVMDDWDGFLQTCTSETYTQCSITIDGETYKNIAIRGKGNTSLSSVASYGNNRYSFKVEFDCYNSALSYYGLDKLSLNNIIQDNTYMKDYIAYTLMSKMGVPAPLCSFAAIYVNDEYWGLYLAVEGVEDGFLSRNGYSTNGDLYKPDSMSFGGGGPGNGGGFNFDDIKDQFGDLFTGNSDSTTATASSATPGGTGFPFGNGGPSGFDPSNMPGGGNAPGGFGGGNSFGMGSSDVKLQYIDDDASSYSNIFNNAKTKVTKEDQQRLITSLKTLSEGGTAAQSVVDTDEVMRYLVVHSFLCNDDSYTGMMVHNYYLYEENGILSIIPWDYNLSMGGFSGGTNGTSTVNSSIDSPVNGSNVSDRPLISWIFDSDETIAAYHELYNQFVSEWLENGWLTDEIERVSAMIDSYVKDDPTAFCTYDEFTKGVETLKTFCERRTQSIRNQLNGTNESVDASDLVLSDMGSMNNSGMGGGMSMPDASSVPGGMTMPDGASIPSGMTPPDSSSMPNSTSSTDRASMPSGTTPPDGTSMPNGNASMDGSSMPNGNASMDGSSMPNGMSFPGNGSMPGNGSFDGSFGGSSGGQSQSTEASPSPAETPSGTEASAAAQATDGTTTATAKGNQQPGQSGMSAPDGTVPGGTMPEFISATPTDAMQQSTTGNQQAIITILVCVVLLAAGILFAARSRDHNR